jgi:PEP-CTERM motif
MKKVLLGAAMAASMLLVAPAAYAAQEISFTPPAVDGSISGTFGNVGLAEGAFEDTFTFNWPSNGTGGATISSVFSSALTDVNFTSVTLNGKEFDILSTGSVEFRKLEDLLLPVANTLVVKGWSGGSGSYSGTLAFAPTAAVPEPATWAMMIIGFGAAGSMVRSRRKLVPSVA